MACWGNRGVGAFSARRGSPPHPLRSGGVRARAMIYARDDMRYIEHAFPVLYVRYKRRVKNLIHLGETRAGWSFTGSVCEPTKELAMLNKWFREQLDCCI